MTNNNIASIIYLRNKLHKWKNIAVLSIIFCVLLTLKFTFTGSDVSVGEGNFIAEVNIEGVIFQNKYRSDVLAKIANDDKIKAVIVNINSPGGGIVGSEILYEDLKNISKKKPIVALMGSVAASGGYMASVASQYIIARNGTLTGSIGVIMESPEMTQLADKIGVKFNSYKSSPLKGSPSLFEKPTPYVDNVIQSSIDDSYDFFVGLVLGSREKKIKKQYLKIAFDGRVFTGRQALEVGLIDEIGGKNQALNYLYKKNIDKNLPVKEVKTYKDEKNLVDKLFSKIPFFQEITMSKGSSQIMAIMQ